MHYYNSSSPTSTTTTITRSASKAAQTESEEFSKVHLQEEKAANNNGDDEYTNTLTPWLRQLWDANNDKDTSGNVEPSTIGKSLSLEPSVGKFPPAAAGAVVESEQNDDDDADNDVPVDENVGDDESDESIPNTNDDSFKDPKQSWAIDSLLYPHIRACLSDATFESHELAIRDTGLSVCTLGTGAGNATKLRSNTCTVVCNGGYSYLVDAGEGLQRQFLASRINFRDVRKIFITHMHGDHVFGLPGLLLNMQVSGLHANKQRSIEIYGPVGLYNYIATVLSLTGTELRKLSVEVYELQGGTQRSMRYAGNRKTFPEFHHKVRASSDKASSDKAACAADFHVVVVVVCGPCK